MYGSRYEYRIISAPPRAPVASAVTFTGITSPFWPVSAAATLAQLFEAQARRYGSRTLLKDKFRKQWRALAPANLPAGEVHRVVTLASLVEKETGLAAERPVVAGVFANRLRLNMPLQCDPTTVYAALLDSRYNGVIHKSDLASTNPYNTYAHGGLPPGPIANPGALSLKAALHPSSESYLYFVARADGSGGHRFSATLTEHEKAVADFRKASH